MITAGISAEGERLRVAMVLGTRAGEGGLGLQSATAVASLARPNIALEVFGRGYADRWPIEGSREGVRWHDAPEVPSMNWLRYSWLRWRTGRFQFQRDVHLGHWAADQIKSLGPSVCYCMTQVGLETLRWAQEQGIPSVVETPNGHLRALREIYVRESRDLCGTNFHGHPTEQMVRRVEEEYERATWIRVSSPWAYQSMIAGGVPAGKIYCRMQPTNTRRFFPASADDSQAGNQSASRGPLRLCYTGSLDLRKGFVYLLRAMRKVGPALVQLRIVGATGDRDCRRLFAAEAEGLQVSASPGDPVNAYREAELFVLPSLEDGSAFVIGEAMASGLPVVVTDQCGNQDWVEHGVTGWVIPARSVEALADALSDALRRRPELREMGRRSRTAIERLGSEENLSRAGEAFMDLLEMKNGHGRT